MRLFRGKNPKLTTRHRHPAIQLVVAESGGFKTRDHKTEEWILKKGLLIKPNLVHQCDATDLPILSLDIDPASALGEWVQSEILKKDEIISYPSSRFKEINFQLVGKYLRSENWDDLRSLLEDLFGFDNSFKRTPQDERIEIVLDHIHQNIHSVLTSKELTGVAFLSESRLLHLFKNEVGLPIRNYILWYRLKVAFHHFVNGSSLTESAHFAGFADQSHFTRTCLSMVGFTPSTLLKNSKFVQVSFLR
jgi:AraC-like DNA-binding protein